MQSTAGRIPLVIVGATGMVAGYALRYALGHHSVAPHVRVAVRERESSNAFRVESREYLGDTAATIVSDKIHLIDVQRIEKFAKHLGIRGDRYVLVRRDFRVAVRKQVDRDRQLAARGIQALCCDGESRRFARHARSDARGQVDIPFSRCVGSGV
jgi:hypothetical protein